MGRFSDRLVTAQEPKIHRTPRRPPKETPPTPHGAWRRLCEPATLSPSVLSCPHHPPSCKSLAKIGQLSQSNVSDSRSSSKLHPVSAESVEVTQTYDGERNLKQIQINTLSFVRCRGIQNWRPFTKAPKGNNEDICACAHTLVRGYGSSPKPRQLAGLVPM